MATVQKKPKRLPKAEDENKNVNGDTTKGKDVNGNTTKGKDAKGDPAKGKDAKGDTTKSKDVKAKDPPPGKRKELPPLKRAPKKGFSDSKSVADMPDDSNTEINPRKSLTANTNAKFCFFYVDNNYTFAPVKMLIHPTKHRKLGTVARDLSERMRPLPFGVRSIFTPRGRDKIRSLDELTHEGSYVCSTKPDYAHGMDIARVQSKRVWHHTRPDSGRRRLNAILKELELSSGKHRSTYRPGYDLSNVYTRVPPKKVTVMKNGESDNKHLLLLNRRTAQTFEQVLKTLSDMFDFAVRKLYTIDGEEVRGLQMLLNGPSAVVAGGVEPFIELGLEASSRNRTRMSMGSQRNLNSRIHQRLKTRQEKNLKTKGRWHVTILTNARPSAGTQAQVTMTVYGHKGNSGPLTLGSGDGRNFHPGQVDEFDISVGNIGEVYKIRLAHDNSGDFPGWLCDEVSMVDQDSGEELTFSCHRWLARDEDDQEITRELAVKRPGDPFLPLIKYQVDVFTGDLWGGGTDANVYITIYGDRGDTGVRQLYTETKGVYFKQGQLDTFEVEAVSLGHLKRIIVGHDGTGPGSGWYLDKIVIREPPFKPNVENVFYCGKWLDEGEDDGKIVRELKVQDEYMDDILEKRNWEYEKWKYDKDCQVMLFSIMTGKALRLNKDNTVDGFAEEKDPLAKFTVHCKKPMKPMFSSQALNNHFLAIDGGRISGMGKGGPHCEFRVRVQQDRTTLFESVKSPLQFLSIGADGYPAEVRGILDKEPSKRFYVYAKGMFRHKGVVMFGTSLLQTVSVNTDGSMTGRGRRHGAESQFRVHKISAGGIRMFESVSKPGSFIRLKDGKIDCNGVRAEESHFQVLRHKDKGYVTLQSSYQRGLFIGMTTDGKVHTTIDTGVRNIWLFPEVVEWGVPKTRSTAMVEEEIMDTVRREMTPESRMSNKELAPVKQFAEGDWSISVSTLTDLKDGDVALVAYGDKGSSGPIVLAAPPGKPVFQEGNEDEFRANLLKIGKMYKIRLELIPKHSTRPASWRVKEVRMQDLNTNEVLKFTINRWLSREEDDHEVMREAPVVRPGENVLPIHTYVVSINTGKEKGSETDADVYITAYGERGDWGKRYLQDSTNIKKFRVGQVDVFYVEAVSLGNIQRCVIGHDGTGAGEGWYCDQVVIKESESALNEFVFPCQRWLDTGMEDRKIERTLMVKENNKKPGGKTKYLVEVSTGAESGSPTGGRVHITLYGSDKKSDQITLYASNPNQKTFEPGNIDSFTIETDNLGDLYKIRIGREDNDTWDRWFLEEVKLTDQSTNEVMTFSFKRWLARDMDDGDLDRELPVILPGKPHPKVRVYQVQMFTGDHWGASTDANMFITMFGTKGDSGRRLLHKCNNNRVKFQRGQMDVFKFEVVSLEELTSVVVSHDGRGHGAGVFLDKVVVKETDTDSSHLQYVFPCGRWLDDHEDDCLTERILRMIDIVDSNQPAPAKASHKSSGRWSVMVKTSSVLQESPSSLAYLTIYGTGRQSDRLPLTAGGEAVGVFKPGEESQFQVDTGDIGRVTKIRLEHDNFGPSPFWRVDYVKLHDLDTGEDLVFYLDRWLAADKDDGQTCREMPAVRKGTAALPVLRYIVAITTGSYKDAGTESGNVGINLIGVDGDSGVRELVGPISKNRLPWQSGQTDIFVLEAVSVGRLKKIELQFVSTAQDRWYVQQVSVMEGARSPSQFTCVCHQWMLSSDSQLVEFPVAEIEPSTKLIDILETTPKGLERPVRSKGRWTVYVQTGSQTDSGTEEKVRLVLCGLKGESEPILLNAKDSLHPGSLVKFETKVADIGLLFKVRLYYEDKHFGSSWFLGKMKLKDKDTGEEIIFEHNDWLESTNENPEGAVELSVTRPDLAPLKEQIYIISVKTGDLPRAETDSSIYCSLIGQWGSTGQRSLSVSSNKDTFKAGQVDQFTVTSIELGDVQKVLIGHTSEGRGQGWYCDRVIVKVAEEVETVFPCNRWLDTGCDDRMLETVLLPLTKLPANFSPPSKYIQTTGGSWNFHVTYAGLDHLPEMKPGHQCGEVSVVVYGTESVQGPLELRGADDPNSPIALLCPGKTDSFYNFDLSDIGEVLKIRVSSGYEGDTESIWTIQQVVMEEQNSKDRLLFDFRAWVGEVGGDIRKEMVVVKPDMSHKEVVQYYIEVHTSDAEMNASTNANVFITLYGKDSDSGRRHLIRNLDNNKRFQAGKVDKFLIEAVDLGHLEKVVVAKGPGKPWLLEKIVIKRGQYAAEEQVFLFDNWIGDKSNQAQEVEETIKVTATIPSHIAIPLQEVPHLNISKGCWTIDAVTGGRRGPTGPLDLVVVFCGQQTESKPCPLVSDKEEPLQIGLTDVFKVKYDEKIGDLRKIRFGFIDKTVAKAWYVRKVTFEDDDTHDIFWSEVNEWVAVDNKLDGWKEVPVPWPAVTLQPVVRYVVTVQVGMVNIDWSDDDDVHISIYGDQGGTGVRLLKHSLSNSKKIKTGQVDVFEVEAVHLGDLVKLVVGHGNKSDKGGFFLEQIKVQESPDAPEIVFECKNWLDKGEADGQIERTLFPTEGVSELGNSNNNNASEITVPLITPRHTPTPTPDREPTPVQEIRHTPTPTPDREPTPVQEVVEVKKEPLEQQVMEAETKTVESPRQPTPQAEDEWSISVTTGGKAGDGTNSPAVLVLYGARGHSQPHCVGDSPDFRFSMGNTDTFKIKEAGDLGEIYKVRVGFPEEDSSSATWFIDKLTLTHLASQKKYEFAADVTVKNTEYQDFWRELPVIRPDNQLAVYTYQVTIYTGQESKAGTDATVFLQVFGECGDTGYRKLMASKTHTNKLEKGNKDVFELSAVDLGKLSKIKIKHDGSGPGSGWLLDRVVIQENPDTTIRYVFRYGRWLDEGDGESGVEQTLMLSDILVSDEEEQDQDLPGTPWQIVTVTGDEASQGTDCPVELVLYDRSGHNEKVVIGEREDFRFSMGATDTFNVRMLEEFSNLYKVRVGFHGDADKHGWLDNYGDAPTWFLQELRLMNEQSGNRYEIQYPTWVRQEATQDHWRELPVIQPDGTMPVVYQYVVQVYTGDTSKAGTDANVFLCLYGSCGDTGMRRLMASKTNSNKFEQGNMDVFEVNAVDLGDLEKVKVSHDGAGMGSGWFLDKIVVMETEESRTKYVFKCQGWLDVSNGERMVSQEFPLSEVLEGQEEEEVKPAEVREASLVQEEEKNPVTFKPGDWKVLITTGSDRNSGTDSNVMLTVYGDADNSGPIQLGSKDTGFFYAGKTDEFEIFLNPEDLGQLRKIRLEHDNSGSAWHVEKVVLHNQTDGSEIVFAINQWLTLDQPGCDIAVEVPVQGLDWPVIPVRDYVVSTWTGDGFGAGTDASVYINLIGTLGDTGHRWLIHNSQQTESFQSGQHDMFVVRAVDLGRLMQIRVGHKGKGPGSGWFLKTVRVKEAADAEDVYVFKCEQWLHDEKGDGLTERLLSLDHMEKDLGEADIKQQTHLKPGTATSVKAKDEQDADVDEGKADMKKAENTDEDVGKSLNVDATAENEHHKTDKESVKDDKDVHDDVTTARIDRTADDNVDESKKPATPTEVMQEHDAGEDKTTESNKSLSREVSKSPQVDDKDQSAHQKEVEEKQVAMKDVNQQREKSLELVKQKTEDKNVDDIAGDSPRNNTDSEQKADDIKRENVSKEDDIVNKEGETSQAPKVETSGNAEENASPKAFEKEQSASEIDRKDAADKNSVKNEASSKDAKPDSDNKDEKSDTDSERNEKPVAESSKDDRPDQDDNKDNMPSNASNQEKDDKPVNVSKQETDVGRVEGRERTGSMTYRVDNESSKQEQQH